MTPEPSQDGKHKAVFVLRPSSLLTLLFLGLAAVVLAYVAGVMSGRHGDVAKETPPQAEEKAVEEPAEKILAPDQLEFARVLRGQPRLEPERAPSQPEPAAEKAPPAAAASDAPGMNPAREEDAAPEEAKAGTGETFDYVFQMGAFRDEAGADALRERLEGHGYRTMLEKGGKMRVVLVRLRGSASQAEELIRLAASLKLGAPLLRERKPVSR